MSHSPGRAECVPSVRWALASLSHRSIAFYETALKPLGIVHAIVFDPDGYRLEAVYKSWQHRQS
jgi:hypothetical protein